LIFQLFCRKGIFKGKITSSLNKNCTKLNNFKLKHHKYAGIDGFPCPKEENVLERKLFKLISEEFNRKEISIFISKQFESIKFNDKRKKKFKSNDLLKNQKYHHQILPGFCQISQRIPLDSTMKQLA
jgi:hypothetical protein